MMCSNSRILQSAVSRALIGLFDAAWFAAIAFVLLLGTAQPAYAYVDPSVMTYTIQALAGVAVALSAVMGVVWRRIRRHLMRFLRIDENANKEVDPAVQPLDMQASDYQDRSRQADAVAQTMKQELQTEKPEKLLWGTRFFFALAASIMLCFTFAIFGPLEIVASGGLSLLFTVGDVWQPLLACAVGGSLVLALALSLVRGRAFGVCFAIVVAVAIAAYIQAMFLNGALPPADGSHVEWNNFRDQMVLSGFVWVAIIVVCIVLSIKKSLLFKGAASAACAVCLIAQGISLGMLFSAPNVGNLKPIDEKPVVTMQGMLDVSSKENVIMIILDTFDQKFLTEALQENPQALDEFTGFTCFTNATGSMIPTRYALSNLLTGNSLKDSDKVFSAELIRQWYEKRNVIDDINEHGYQTDLYTSDVYDAIGPLSIKTENIRVLKPTIDPVGTIGVLLKCSLYRFMPWVAKPPFWFYTDEINKEVLGNRPTDLADMAWNTDDVAYFDLLKKKGLSVKDIGEAGSYRVLHFNGAHYPYFMDRYGNRLKEEGSQIDQCLGSLLITSEYLKQLKQLGVYDNATILVVSDHGEWEFNEEMTYPSNPILLVKPKETAQEASQPVAYTSSPTGHLDIADTILAAIGATSPSYGGMNVFDVPDQDRLRYFNATIVQEPGSVRTGIMQWQINGNALDWKSWSKTGKVWPVEGE